MNSSAILVCLILSFISSTTATFPIGGSASGTLEMPPQQLIEESCTNVSKFVTTVPKQYCVSVLSTVSFPKPTMCQRDLAEISLNLLIMSVRTTKAKLELLAHGPLGQTNPKLRNVFQQCISMYNECNRRTKEATDCIAKEDYGPADRTISLIQGHGSECEDLFKEEVKIDSPLTKENQDCEFLSGMTCMLIRFFDKSYTPDGLKGPGPN